MTEEEKKLIFKLYQTHQEDKGSIFVSVYRWAIQICGREGK